MPFWKKNVKPVIPSEIKDLIELRHNNMEAGLLVTTDKELVVDDNQVNRDVLVRILKKYGYKESEQASNGLETLERTTDTDYRIIWLDVKMPILSGRDTAKYLRANYPNGMGYKGFIVGVTGFADEESINCCLSDGMNVVLTKPYVGDHVYRLHNHSFFRSND